MAHAIILSGGPAHDYGATSAMLVTLLAESGITAEIQEDPNFMASPAAQRAELLVMNCARWSCHQTPDWEAEWAFELSEAAQEGMLEFLLGGRGMLALHAATLCFDNWPEWAGILGAKWQWGQSDHAPLQEHTMHIAVGDHPITEGLDDFTIYDELYTDPTMADPIDPLVVARWDGKRQPILWLRQLRKARVCYNALGHGVEALEHPTLQALLRRGAEWAIGRS